MKRLVQKYEEVMNGYGSKGIVCFERIVRKCIEGELSEGDSPFMFMSPSDTKNLISLKIFKIMAGILPSLTYGNQNGSSVLPRLLDENSTGAVDTGQGITGQPSRYQDLLDANPYRGLHYNESGWQKFISGLGFRTGADDFREQAEINAREYDAGIMSMQMQNQFNSPAEMASRMRDAGLNPDLQGISDVASSASPTEDPNGMPAQDSDAQMQKAISTVGSICSSVFGALQSTFAIMKDSKALKNLQLTNDNLAIKNQNDLISGGNSLQELISSVVWKTTSPDQMPDPKTLSGSLERALSGIFTDEDMYERASKVAQEFAAGLPQDLDAWKAWHERAGQKVGYASYAGSQDYSEDMTDAMLEFYGFQRDLYNAVKIASANLDISNSNEQIEYNDAHNATLEGQAANEGYSADIDIARQKAQEARIAKAINSTFDKWCSSLEAKANSKERGSMWASIALALIGMVRLTAMSGMSFSTGRSHSQYHGESSSSRFGFGF